MALGANEQFASRTFSGRPRMVVERNEVGTLSAISGAPELLVGTPLGWDASAGYWDVYTQPSDAAVYTITDQAGATDGGTFILTIDGLASVHAWNATPAAMEAELLAMLADAGKAYTVAVTNTEANIGVSGAVATLTFSENAGAPSVDLDGTGLTDGGVVEAGNLVLAASDAGTQLTGLNEIAGFIAHHAVQTSATTETQAVIMLAGEVHRDDINTATIRALLAGSPSEGELDTALKAAQLRKRGITVRGLAAVEG